MYVQKYDDHDNYKSDYYTRPQLKTRQELMNLIDQTRETMRTATRFERAYGRRTWESHIEDWEYDLMNGKYR